jgi:hypothetical protein
LWSVRAASGNRARGAFVVETRSVSAPAGK